MRNAFGGLIAWCVVSCGGTTVAGDGGAGRGQDSGVKSSMFIQWVLYRSPPQCVVTADAAEPALYNGTLDLAFTKSYTAALLVGTKLTSRITLRAADIDLTDSSGNSLYKFSVNVTGSVAASRNGDPGLGTFDSELVPASIGEELLGKLRDKRLGNKVIALVRVSGTTLGGEDVTSSELSFPIEYCEGCLIDYPLAAINPQTNKCVSSDATELPVRGCKTGQDDYIDCRLCASTNSLCENAPPR